MKSHLKRILIGTAIAIIPGSGIVAGGYMIYLGVQKWRRDGSSIFTKRTEGGVAGHQSCKDLVEELRKELKEGDSRT